MRNGSKSRQPSSIRASRRQRDAVVWVVHCLGYLPGPGRNLLGNCTLHHALKTNGKPMTTSSARESSRASEIGKYHLVAELARGGMGNIYLAASQGPGSFSKLLVVKELKPELCEDETYVAMFLDEARLAARLIHPNIVQTNEVGSDLGRHYMVMEFLDGRSLHRIGKRTAGQLPVGAHLRIIGEALLGLHHAHELREFDGEALGIVHRDVSPLNVFVTFNGQAKVLDFGIAKAIDSSLETKMGVLKGRIAYMAPEQAKGSKVDRRADIYSAGVMLWEAAAGRRLWPAMSEVEILTHLLRGETPTLRSVQPDAPEDLERICARAMAFNREDRYATAADLQHDLEAHIARRSDAMTMREIGAFVAHAFTEERKKMSSIIEETLGRLRGGPRSGTMPTFQAQVVGTPTSASLSCDGASHPSIRLFTPTSSLAPGGSLSRSAPATSATLESAMLAATSAPWGRKRTATLSLGVGVLLVGAVLVGTTLHGARPGAPDAVFAPAVAAPPAAPLAPDTLDLSVRVTPASAQITIDGASVVANPFHARYPRDGQVHRVAASADGYDTKLEDVKFSNDVSIDVSLNRQASAPLHPFVITVPQQLHSPRHLTVTTSAPTPTSPDEASASAPTPAPRVEVVQAPPRVAQPSPARPDVNPTGGRAPLRPISTSNPYGAP
jgi:serine/threonine protein kinase